MNKNAHYIVFCDSFFIFIDLSRGCTMNYADIKRIDVANGPGVRVSLFVSGCPHHCKNCFNQETWDYNYGKPFTQNEVDEFLGYVSNSFIKGITILGGEPLDPNNQREVLKVIKLVRERFPEKSVWIFTGYMFDTELLAKMVPAMPDLEEILKLTDVIVDGRFVEELKNLNLKFKGSSNQRTIMVQKSLKKGEIVLWDENPEHDR